MSLNIARKGPQLGSLILYNRSTSRATAHATKLGNRATVATTLAEVVIQADLIFICVGDDDALDAIVSNILGDRSIQVLANKTFVDCSTVHPNTSRKIEAALNARGADFVACPVFGAPHMAATGQLVVVPAGKYSAIQKVRPFFDGVVAKKTIDLSSGQGGDIDVGRALTLKVLANTFILNTVGVLAESLVAAEVSGLGFEPLKEWLELFAPVPFINYAERMTSGQYYQLEEPLSSAKLARKDLKHASGIAKEGGMHMQILEVMDSLLQGVELESGQNGDVAAVYGVIRKGAGRGFKN